MVEVTVVVLAIFQGMCIYKKYIEAGSTWLGLWSAISGAYQRYATGHNRVPTTEFNPTYCGRIDREGQLIRPGNLDIVSWSPRYLSCAMKHE